MRMSAAAGVLLALLAVPSVRADDEARLLRFPTIHGDTVVFNESFEDVPEHMLAAYTLEKRFTVAKRVTPKRGKMIGFEGKQLRMDVCALYLTDPGVWGRIGFPGPSVERGGYPDFDQPAR